ncbi:cytochrome c-type biogenesis protein [Paracoccus aerodenitrificans]|uniref:cytochrome c-type biogenesis protein n=1 Tax=Paracoccus aerodenitrificans TaxID=3017781 RepID=UPI0022F07782|nr:cytochrome c-type biogenesis protein [Paracoccus aerodenitrificans]WBU65529.1 cytochrome c-type biogenesis protein CcmH [Paracoccus aerodenitrificans]
MKRLLLILLLLPGPVFAVQPDEVLDDAQLEARARDISQDLRCPVCQGENIDESNAAISRDLRIYVRERLVEGDSDAEVVEAVTDRFGEFVLFEPRATGSNLILYLAGPLMALLAALLGWRFVVSRRPPAQTETGPSLSPEERARLDEIMKG